MLAASVSGPGNVTYRVVCAISEWVSVFFTLQELPGSLFESLFVHIVTFFHFVSFFPFFFFCEIEGIMFSPFAVTLNIWQ